MRFISFESKVLSANVLATRVVVGIITWIALSTTTWAQDTEPSLFDLSPPTQAEEPNEIEAAMTAAPVPTDRRQYSGRQLFEHEFEWNGDAAKSKNDVLPSNSPINLSVNLIEDVKNGDGLGPLYNAKSCVTCHVAGGGSNVEHNVTLITLDPRIKPNGTHEDFASELRDVFPTLVGPRGVVSYNSIVHNHSTRAGYEAIRNHLASHVEGGIADDWFKPEDRTSEAIARQPVIAGRYRGIDFYLSQRNSPPLFGLGLIEAVSQSRLEVLAKQQSEKSGGKITGRVAGKFGWQGQSASLRSFVVAACAGEMGLNQLTLSQPPDPADLTYINKNVDMTATETSKIFEFVSKLPQPLEFASDVKTHRYALAGEKIFNSIGCVTCHIPDVRPAKNIFSDLLLHDMGDRLQGPSPAPTSSGGGSRILTPVQLTITSPPALSIGAVAPGYYDSNGFARFLPEPYPIARPEKPQFPRGKVDPDKAFVDDFYTTSWDALQREWKTPPLWGVRDTGPYLHDGRAKTIGEAILWHGGEAEDATVAFTNLSRADKDLVLKFLDSLQAPRLPEDVPSR